MTGQLGQHLGRRGPLLVFFRDGLAASVLGSYQRCGITLHLRVERHLYGKDAVFTALIQTLRQRRRQNRALSESPAKSHWESDGAQFPTLRTYRDLNRLGSD